MLIYYGVDVVRQFRYTIVFAVTKGLFYYRLKGFIFMTVYSVGNIKKFVGDNITS